MDHEPIIRVVLGEAAPDAGILRFVLEGEGFDLVGQASNDDELARVLLSARPSVIVLDAAISATAALDARQRIGCAAVVVVWPPGVAAVVAEERVDPDRVIEELGHAVRRAATRPGASEALTDPGELIDLAALEEEEEADALIDPDEVWVPGSTATRRPRTARRHPLLAAAVTFAIYATAMTAIAATVPDTIARFDRGPDGRSSPTVAETPASGAGAGSGSLVPGATFGSGGPGDDRGSRGQGSGSRGPDDDRGQGQGNGGKGQGNGGEGNGGQGQGNGGKGQGNGGQGQGQGGGQGQGQGGGQGQGQGGGQGQGNGQGQGQGGGQGGPNDDRGRPAEPDDEPQEDQPEDS